MSQVKVVELKVEAPKAAKLAPLAHTIRQQCKSGVRTLLDGLFNGTDDALFELADRSQSNSQQEMYFDAMRTVRLHRKAITKSFLERLSAAFEELAGGRPPSQAHDDDHKDDETGYTLLGQDELEMSVAVSGIVSKVTSQYSLTIMQLTKRLDELVEGHTVSERNNPIGPAVLSQIFADCLEGLDVHIRIRIILMKLFERFVMERIGPLYESINQALIKAGILPDLRQRGRNSSRNERRPEPRENRATHSQSSGSPAAARIADGASRNDIDFDTVQSLLAGIRSGDVAGPESHRLPLDPQEVVTALSDIQRETSHSAIDIEQVPQLHDVRTLVLSHRDGSASKSLGRADEDTFNFVGMLFDYILNDRNLAIPMKALIGRLQIPIIKVAIVDKSFFSKSAHPARALLNELSSAGIGWSSAKELKRDALYNKIENVVARVLDDFGDDPDIFSDLLKELREFVAKDTRRSVLVEQRVKESETGKAKTQGAKVTVQALINQKACGLRLPVVAGKFISETWSRVLTMRCIKHGQGSTPWTDGVAALDDLLWVLQPLSDLDEIDRRDDMASQVLEHIAAGMHEIGSPEDDIDVFTGWLSAHLQDLSSNDRQYLADDEAPEVPVAMDVIDEIVLAPPDADDDEYAACSPEFIEPLKHLTEGTWVEIGKAGGTTPVRCKLATITQPGHRYVFVNRRGMKVFEEKRMGIARLIDQDQLRLIDESQVFDRALQSVIGNLRQMQRRR